MRLLLPTLLLVAPALAFAQGTLDPSGAPAPAMKSLDQIEPRIPIGKVGGSTEPIVISAPGAYMLQGDLTVTANTAIVLNAGDVTLDLNGFTLTALGAHAAISGMATTGDITIHNGRIVGGTTYDKKTNTFTGEGANYGIVFAPFDGTCTISDITIRGMGAAGILIQTTTYSQIPQRFSVRRCTISVCGGQGIVAGTITDSTAETCGSTALSALTVSNSVGICVAQASGIRAYTVTNSYGQSQSAYGIVADNDGAPHLGNATNCRGVSATGTGLFATAATNCIGLSTSGTGLLALAAENCTGETAASDGFGLTAETATNCRGINTTGTGLFATTATNCVGLSSSGTGLDTNSGGNHYTGTATGCVGRSTTGHGLIASIATNCHGATAAAAMYGLWVSGTATGCRGTNTAANGVALRTDIAVACTAAAGSVVANTKQLGTP